MTLQIAKIQLRKRSSKNPIVKTNVMRLKEGTMNQTAEVNKVRYKRMMKKRTLLALVLAITASSVQAAKEQIVIAHRGASGYLPEHTLESKVAAYFMGADYIEQDLAMTKDNQLVVVHDITLERTTDVMSKFPDRARVMNGQRHWYVMDFTLNEIKSLKVTEGFDIPEGLGASDSSQPVDMSKVTASYPERFPLWKSSFTIPTFQEEIELIQGLNQSTGRHVGIYPEIKSPAIHRQNNKDIAKATLRVLKEYGYRSKDDRVYLQSFDPNENIRIKNVLMPELGMDLNLIQLIAETDWNETQVYQPDGKMPNYNYDWMFEPGAMNKIAQYADGIGPWKPMLVDEKSTKDNIVVTGMMAEARNAHLVVHPYTFRKDAGRIPAYASDFEDMLNVFYNKVGVDGVFTDYPDRAVQFLR